MRCRTCHRFCYSRDRHLGSYSVFYSCVDCACSDSFGQYQNVTGLCSSICYHFFRVNNAGYGLWGYFRELSGESQHHMLQINMMTLFDLTYDLLPILSDHTPSYILNVGSMAGLQAMPSLSGYSASKAFVNTFSRALHDELKPLGITVTVLTPGSVDTNFVAVSGMTHMEEMAKKTSMTPEVVAEAAVRAMFNKKKQVTPGFSNRLASFGVKHMPKGWIEHLVASMYRKKDR